MLESTTGLLADYKNEMYKIGLIINYFDSQVIFWCNRQTPAETKDHQQGGPYYLKFGTVLLIYIIRVRDTCKIQYAVCGRTSFNK